MSEYVKPFFKKTLIERIREVENHIKALEATDTKQPEKMQEAISYWNGILSDAYTEQKALKNVSLERSKKILFN